MHGLLVSEFSANEKQSEYASIVAPLIYISLLTDWFIWNEKYEVPGLEA